MISAFGWFLWDQVWLPISAWTVFAWLIFWGLQKLPRLAALTRYYTLLTLVFLLPASLVAIAVLPSPFSSKAGIKQASLPPLRLFFHSP